MAQITGKWNKWKTSSYLEHRERQTVINGCTFDNKSVMAGILQGSVLGPLLFLVYINDIIDTISYNIILFADDNSLFITLNDNYSLG